MNPRHKIRDPNLIEKMEEVTPVQFKGTIWRIVKEGRDALECSASGGRWDDSTFDVLYTSKTREGAISELYYHLSKGLPVIPSKINYKLYEITVELDSALTLIDINEVANLGVDTSKFGKLSYQEREQEYPRTQDVGETAHFLGCDGLDVPSARNTTSNIVIFCDRLSPDKIKVEKDHGVVNWSEFSPQ